MKKRILLAYPNEKRIIKHFGDRPPLSLLFIAAHLRKQGHKVRVWDGNHQTEAELLGICKNFKPEYVGVSVYTSSIMPEAISLANLIKNHNKEIKIIAGGYHAIVLHESLPKNFDYICVGEGERVVEEILKKPNERIVVPPKVMDIDEIPLPARDLVDMRLYNMEQNGKRTATLVTSRGCPYDCVFCGNINRKVRFHSTERIEKEVKELIDKYKFKSFYFLDDLFTLDKKRTFEIIKKLKPLNISYRIMTRSDNLNEEMIKALAESGCEIVSIGIESGSNKILKNANKMMTTKQNEEVVKLCSKYGINVKGFFMVGLPGETEETANQTIEFAKRLKKQGLTSADFYLMTPFPGTKIWDNPKEYGIEIIDRNFSEYLIAGNIVESKIKTEFLSGEKLKYLVKKAKIEFENA
ncbi:hypothetical protein CL621_02880 [archaeon]|nr:hypothetical protein [archaeon]|tara:strand:+ start:2240 stop:3469 length:1230 start_codon:yes stop_codon:yes gene_type:complete